MLTSLSAPAAARASCADGRFTGPRGRAPVLSCGLPLRRLAGRAYRLACQPPFRSV